MTQHCDILGTRIVVIATEDPQTCELCGAFEETRPYGKNGIEICFDCAMLDEKTTSEQLVKRLISSPK